LVVETVSVNSENATPIEGYYAAKLQTVSVIGLTALAVTVVPEHGVSTVRRKLEGITS
jgi:hypothetical protein